jgi:hypothetical protein
MLIFCKIIKEKVAWKSKVYVFAWEDNINVDLRQCHLKEGSGPHGDIKFGRGRDIIPMPGKKVLEHCFGFILLGKNFQNGVLVHFITKLLLILGKYIMKTWNEFNSAQDDVEINNL